MTDTHIEEHDRGLVYDLATIEAQLIGRRKALAWFTTAGAAALVTGCGGGIERIGQHLDRLANADADPDAHADPKPHPQPDADPTACTAVPAETGGPYPADGTNNSSGSTSNVLTSSGVVRSDIRPSFIGSTTVAQGVQLTITLTIVNVNASCGALAGYAVYLWHCDRDGRYSLYDVPAESYLRGVQVANAAGQVTFTTIFPACYAGRFPHMHFEVFSSVANATSGRFAVLTSQLAMPRDICTTVYDGATGYLTSITRFASVSTSSDGVFGDNSSAQLAAMTPAMTGSIAAGYTATATIGIAT